MSEPTIYTCYYCKGTTADWDAMLQHRCLSGGSALCLDDNNVVYLEKDEAEVRNEASEPTASTSTEPEEQEHCKTDWQNAAVLLLIEQYRLHKNELEKKNSLKKHIWQRIASTMNEHSHSYSWDQCQNKWKSLMRTYKSMKDHNNKTGRNRQHWAFFDPIDELMSNNPAIEPPIVIHNGREAGAMVGQSRESPQSRRCGTSNTGTRKRQTSVSIAELCETAIEQNKRQHDDNLQEKRRFNDLLEKLVNNITSNPGKKD